MGNLKELEKIRNNPNDVTPDRLEKLCRSFGFLWKHGSNHDIVSHELLVQSYTVPRHKPVKRPYVKNVIKMIDEIKSMED